MPSLSVLKRSVRDSSPWQMRPWHHPQHPQQHGEHDAAAMSTDEECESGSGYGSGYGSGTELSLDTTPPSGNGSTATTKKERRDSKRDLLHDLISRSLRGAGRALMTSAPPSPAPSASSSPPHDQQHHHHHHHQHHQHQQQTQPPQPPPQPQHAPSLRLLLQRPRQTSATTTATTATASTAAAGDKTESPPQLRSALQTTPLLSTPSRSAFVNTNKPLPSPPLPGSELDVGPPAKPVLKLTRIMATLSDDDIEKLFSGAPQYFARSEGHFTGAPHPSVAYPWDETLEIRDLTDHVQIEDEAWSNVTAWPHITRRSSNNSIVSSIGGASAVAEGGAGTSHDAAGLASAVDDEPRPVKKRSHFYPRQRERPSMLSIQGLEKGTIGYEAALELAVSDALQEEQFGFDTFGSRPAAITEARKNLMDPIATVAAAESDAKATEAGSTSAVDETASGVKFVGETQILEELIKNGRRYADGSFYDERQGQEFYNELFHHILRPPQKRRSRSFNAHKRSLSHTSSGSGPDDHLIPQIEALLDVLATPNVWIDFSHVEWRLRLGQVLFASSAPDDFDPGIGKPEDESQTHHSASDDERYTERYWLLLQILLATELLLRLDAITEGDEYGLEFVRPSEVHRFEKVANPSVRWSLILARTWLENIEIIRVDEEDEKTAKAHEAKTASDPDLTHPSRVNSGASTKSKQERSGKHTIGWITTITKKLSLIDGRLHASKAPEKKHVYAMKAINARRQCRGLAHFAEDLRWPSNLVDVLAQSALHSLHARELLNAKIKNDPAADKDAAAVIDPNDLRCKLEFIRRLPRRRKVVAGLHTGGWLSRSYLSGLILPGDGLTNLLMAALLEGDKAALHALGPIAYLGNGFVYGGKSFWSTKSVVGRVLAAGAGAAECMGWVSSDVLPQGRGNGWFIIDVDDVPDDARLTNRRARIWGKAAIERESSVLGDADPESVLPADFVIPFEAVYKDTPPKHTRVDLQSFELYTPYDVSRPSRRQEEGQKTSTTEGVGDAESPAQACFAETAFTISSDGGPEQTCTYNLSYDIYFVTAHPCVPSQRVKVLKSPSSPTIQQIDVTGTGLADRASTVHTTGHPLHKYYKYASIHLTSLLQNRGKSLKELLVEYAATTNRSSNNEATSPTASSGSLDNTVLVIDCITGFSPQPAAHEMPLSPVVERKPFSDSSSLSSFPALTKEISPIVALSSPPETASSTPQPAAEALKTATAETGTAAVTAHSTPTPSVNTATTASSSKMHHETRRRRFGSDMEILVRAICAEKGWNALISRRRRGCLACAIREAGALGWRVVVRVD